MKMGREKNPSVLAFLTARSSADLGILTIPVNGIVCYRAVRHRTDPDSVRIISIPDRSGGDKPVLMVIVTGDCVSTVISAHSIPVIVIPVTDRSAGTALRPTLVVVVVVRISDTTYFRQKGIEFVIHEQIQAENVSKLNEDFADFNKKKPLIITDSGEAAVSACHAGISHRSTEGTEKST